MHHRRFTQFALALSAALTLTYAGCGSDSGGDSTGGKGGAGTGATGTGGSGNGGSGGTGAFNFGGTGNTSTGGGGSGGTGAGPDACAVFKATSELVPANLLLVIDRSGSMTCNLPSDGQTTAECDAFPAPKDPAKPTKWQLTKTALEQAIDDLATSGNISAGLVVFPRPASDCAVTQTPDVDIKDLTATQVTDLKNFLGTVAPKGSTPLAGATILSYAHLYELLKAGTLKGNLFVVLLTDGYETCAPGEIDKLINQDVPTANQQLNVRTFVIGVPGSENGRALLSQVAWQGGTAKSPTCTHAATPADQGDCHFDMTTSSNFSQDLKNALAQISGSVLACEFDVPAAPPGKKLNTNNVKVEVGGSPISEDAGKSCDQANGWQFSADYKKIYLCGTACDEAKKTGEINIDFGCLSDVR